LKKGPNESLFGPDFFKKAAIALKKDGIVCSQAESNLLYLSKRYLV
jgi:spermidine synthase